MQLEEKTELQRLDEYFTNLIAAGMDPDDDVKPEKERQEGRYFDSLVKRALSGEELPCWMAVMRCLNESTRPSLARARNWTKTFSRLNATLTNIVNIDDAALRKTILDNANIIMATMCYLGMIEFLWPRSEIGMVVKLIQHKTQKTEYLSNLFVRYPDGEGYDFVECNTTLNNGDKMELPLTELQKNFQILQNAGLMPAQQPPAEPDEPALPRPAVQALRIAPVKLEFLEPKDDQKKDPLRQAMAAAEEAINNNNGGLFGMKLLSTAQTEAKAQAALRFAQLKELVDDYKPDHKLTACIRVILKFLREDSTPLDKGSHAYCLMQALAPLIRENFNFAALVAKEKHPVKIRNSFCAQLEQEYCKSSLMVSTLRY